MSAAAEILEPRTNTRVTGRATDLGVGGCYVDTMSPFPVNTSVRIRLVSERYSVQGRATVSYSLTSMGMGLAFTEMSHDQAEVLRAWVGEISGELIMDADFDPAPEPKQGKAPAQAAGVRDILSELIGALERKNVLTSKEASALREKLPG